MSKCTYFLTCGYIYLFKAFIVIESKLNNDKPLLSLLVQQLASKPNVVSYTSLQIHCKQFFKQLSLRNNERIQKRKTKPKKKKNEPPFTGRNSSNAKLRL